MDLSPIGEAVLIAREGRRLKAYRDSVGVWTIGVGHTGAAGPPVVRPGLSIGVEECDRIFSRDVARFVRTVREALPAAEPLPQHAFDALVSLCFNIGPSAFLRSSVLRRLRAGDRPGAAEAILMWDRPAEVMSRRQGEYDQFRTPYETALPHARRGDPRRIARPRSRADKSAQKPEIATAPPPPAPSPEPPTPSPEPPAAPVRVGWLARLRACLWPR